MINIISKPIEFKNELRKKIEFICDFCNTKPKIINGNIRNIEHTNLSYIDPHKVIIKGITFLVFNYSKILYINNLSNSIEIKDLEDNKQIDKLNKDKTDIVDEIDKKKKLNNKIIVKSKNKVWDENEKLKEERDFYKSLSNQYEREKEKSDYLIYHLNKVFKKLPEFIKTIIDHLFNHSSLDLKYFKEQYDPEVIKKREKSFKAYIAKLTKDFNESQAIITNEIEELSNQKYDYTKNRKI